MTKEDFASHRLEYADLYITYKLQLAALKSAVYFIEKVLDDYIYRSSRLRTVKALILETIRELEEDHTNGWEDTHEA